MSIRKNFDEAIKALMRDQGGLVVKDPKDLSAVSGHDPCITLRVDPLTELLVGYLGSSWVVSFCSSWHSGRTLEEALDKCMEEDQTSVMYIYVMADQLEGARAASAPLMKRAKLLFGKDAVLGLYPVIATSEEEVARKDEEYFISLLEQGSSKK